MVAKDIPEAYEWKNVIRKSTEDALKNAENYGRYFFTYMSLTKTLT